MSRTRGVTLVNVATPSATVTGTSPACVRKTRSSPIATAVAIVA